MNLVMKLAMLELLPPLANATELPILLASLSWAPMLRPNAERRLWFAQLQRAHRTSPRRSCN